MKILLTIAAALAAFISVTAASASERAAGHYEWKNRAQPGPNKSNLPSRVRVWVKDMVAVSNRDCAMMKDKASAAACIDMPNHGASTPKANDGRSRLAQMRWSGLPYFGTIGGLLHEIFAQFNVHTRLPSVARCRANDL
jgi:hypothetical protein